MIDPERLCERSTGLLAQLLRAGVEEQPNAAGVQQTLAALGVAGAVLAASSAASGAVSAAAGGAKLSSVTAGASVGGAGLTTSGAAKVASVTLVLKWLSIGVVSGIGLAGAATVVTGPAEPKRAVEGGKAPAARVRAGAAAAPSQPAARGARVDAPASETSAVVAAPSARVRSGEARATAPELDVGSPLAAEVAYVDRARALLGSGQANAGLALLERYEQEFPEARLLPEVLFLQLDADERLGRSSEAKRAAQRLVAGFPKSPHAARARKLLGQ